MPKQLRIGLDIDDTLINSVDTVLALNNEIYNTMLDRSDWFSVTPESLTKWGMKEGPEISDRIHDLMALPDYLKKVVPVAGAKQIVEHLKSEGHKLFAITSRPERIREQTINELAACFPGIFSDETLFMIDAFSADPTKARVTKFEVARQLKLTHFVDDLLIHANALSEGGIKTILLSDDSYHWNRGASQKDVIRLKSWNDIGEYFDNETR